MLRIARLTDYGLVLMAHMAARRDRATFTARELAAETKLPLPTVSKVLKAMANGGLLTGHRGVAGGYQLARAPETISVADVIAAVEGPIALTLCSEGPGACDIEGTCPDRHGMQHINGVIHRALAAITLTEIVRPQQVLQLGAKKEAHRPW